MGYRPQCVSGGGSVGDAMVFGWGCREAHTRDSPLRVLCPGTPLCHAYARHKNPCSRHRWLPPYHVMERARNGFPTPPTPQLHTACRLTAQGLSTVCRAMLHNVTNQTYNTNGIVRRQHRQRDQFGRCTLTTRHERWLNMSESEYRGTNTNETVHKAVSDSHQSAYTHTHGGGSEANAGRAASSGTSRLDSAGETRN